MKTLILSFLFVIISTKVQAQTYEDGSIGYDSIVRELSKNNKSRTRYKNNDPFADIKIHGGAAFASSFMSLSTDMGNLNGNLRGSEVSFGIDLFSPVWVMEVVFRSYGSSQFSGSGFSSETEKAQLESSTISMREFDLRVFHTFSRTRNLDFKLSAGLAARYLNHTFQNYTPNNVSTSSGNIKRGAVETRKYVTPASIFGLGTDFKINSVISLGGDLSYRAPLISDSIENGAINFSLRIDGHF